MTNNYMKGESEKKIILVVFDGLGDEEITVLNDKTPLDFANTPNLDKKAQEGKLGLLSPTFYGNAPTSEEGHFSLFGYDPGKYELKRGIVTAESVGMNIAKEDVTLRGNFATYRDGKIVDRRAGRIKNTEKLVEAISGMEIDGVKIFVEVALDHRVAILMKGEGLSSAVTNSDPAYNGSGFLDEVKPAREGEEERFTADVLNKFSKQVHEILKDHPENKGIDLPANYLVLRGASKKVSLPTFQSRYGMTAGCIAGKDLYREMGKMVGMVPLEVEGATGSVDTNIRGKFEKAISADFDFVFVHIKATDTLAEDGNYVGKTEFLEKADKQITLFDKFKGTLVITSDHSTCSLLKGHCDRKIPLLVHGEGSDKSERFTEKECEKGGLGTIWQVDFLPSLVEKRVL